MREYHRGHPDPSAPELGYPTGAPELVEVPSEWQAWAFGDVHGVLSVLVKALEEAGLLAADGSWAAGPNVALIGLGDYIDRGEDSQGVIAFLRRLAGEMSGAGSRLILVRGNHEQMLADVLRGSDEWFESWAANGGLALARSHGIAGVSQSMASFCDEIRRRDPDILVWLLQTLPYARWRDVLFVHAGVPRGADLVSLLDSDGQLWDPDSFVTGVGLALDPELDRLRRGGCGRVVVGHTPQSMGATVDHDGCLLMLDTVGLDGAGWFTVAKIALSGSLATSSFTLVDASRAPDRPRG